MLAPQNLPKISCLLVTAAGRWDRLLLSYRCYLDQTYPNRELVIVNEGPPEYQEQLRELTEGREDVKCIFLRGDYTLGGLRNIAMQLCNGDLFVQWDDDDYNTPERLAVQYAFMATKPKARACFLGDQLHYYFPTKQLYWDNWWFKMSAGMKKWGLIPGTIMAYRKDFPYRYPSSGDFARAAEDSVLTGAMCDEEESRVEILCGRGYMQMYTFHAKNVWDMEHHLNISKLRGCDSQYVWTNREYVSRTLRYLKLEPPIEVMGCEGLAFVYKG